MQLNHQIFSLVCLNIGNSGKVLSISHRTSFEFVGLQTLEGRNELSLAFSAIGKTISL
jgi:hypothetical protein